MSPLRRALFLAVLVLIADQASKWWILETASDAPRVREVTDFFNLVLVRNRGVSFGMLRDQGAALGYLFPLVMGAVVAGLLVWLRRVHAMPVALALGAVIGGAIGNIIDRVRLGAVTDFLDFHWQGWHWPAFNIADSAICLGVIVLLIDSFRRRE
jgi:signal peptidase II